MRNITIGAMVCAMAMATPATAQSVPDDVRCFVLSNAFAKQAKDAGGRQLAAASMAFYMGRLDGRADPKTIAENVRRVGAAIDPKAAGALMSACANHMGRSEQALQTAIRALAPKK